MDKPKMYHTTLVGHWKRPHLLYEENCETTQLAILLVEPDEFYNKLGKALGIRFVEGVTDD